MGFRSITWRFLAPHPFLLSSSKFSFTNSQNGRVIDPFSLELIESSPNRQAVWPLHLAYLKDELIPISMQANKKIGEQEHEQIGISRRRVRRQSYCR